MRTFDSYGLSAWSLYKLLYIGLALPLFVFGVGCGIASLLGRSTIQLNGAYVYGFKGLIAGVILGIVLPFILSFFLWMIMSIGILCWTRLGKIRLSIKD